MRYFQLRYTKIHNIGLHSLMEVKDTHGQDYLKDICESPIIFSINIHNCFAQCELSAHSQLLIYVDELLTAPDTEEHVNTPHCS